MSADPVQGRADYFLLAQEVAFRPGVGRMGRRSTCRRSRAADVH